MIERLLLIRAFDLETAYKERWEKTSRYLIERTLTFSGSYVYFLLRSSQRYLTQISGIA